MTTRRNFSHPAAVMSQEHNEDQAFEARGSAPRIPGRRGRRMGALPDRFNVEVLGTLRGWAACQFLRACQRCGGVVGYLTVVPLRWICFRGIVRQGWGAV